MKTIVKEYVVVRSILENDPTYQKRINSIDTFLQEEDVDKVFEYVEKQKK